jgi:hypothetical protein
VTDESLARIDLESLADLGSAEQADRVIGAVLARVAAQQSRARLDVLSRVALLARPAIAVAALILVTATMAMHFGVRPTAVSPASASANVALTRWIEHGRAPSNAELVAVFEGYGR